LPYAGRVNVEMPLILAPGERIFFVTGRSPIGVSFQVNTCSGFLEQFQDFSPPLPKLCPGSDVDAYNSGYILTQSCINYISTLPRCEVYSNALPTGLGNSCSDYVYNKINYNTCADTHKNDPNFYQRDWYVFAGASQELWDNAGDLVRLYDARGNLVDSIAY